MCAWKRGKLGEEYLRCHLQKIHFKMFLYQLPLSLSTLLIFTFKHVIPLLLTLNVFALTRSPK